MNKAVYENIKLKDKTFISGLVPKNKFTYWSSKIFNSLSSRSNLHKSKALLKLCLGILPERSLS